jgi:hypothetical protein
MTRRTKWMNKAKEHDERGFVNSHSEYLLHVNLSTRLTFLILELMISVKLAREYAEKLRLGKIMKPLFRAVELEASEEEASDKCLMWCVWGSCEVKTRHQRPHLQRVCSP